METILTIFTGVLAFAVVVQTLLFFGIYKSIRRITVWMDGAGKELLRHISVVSSKVDECLNTVKGMGEDLKPLTAKLADTTDLVRKGISDLNAFISEATDTARVEILRIQNTMKSAGERADEIIDQLYKGILAPVNEITAITQGIRTAFDFLFRRRKSLSRGSAQDEEMFI